MLTLYIGFYFISTITLPSLGQNENLMTLLKSKISWHFETVQNFNFCFLENCIFVGGQSITEHPVESGCV